MIHSKEVRLLVYDAGENEMVRATVYGATVLYAATLREHSRETKTAGWVYPSEGTSKHG